MNYPEPEFPSLKAEANVFPEGHDEKTVVLKGQPFTPRVFVPGEKCPTCGSLDPCRCPLQADRHQGGHPVFMKGGVYVPQDFNKSLLPPRHLEVSDAVLKFNQEFSTEFVQDKSMPEDHPAYDGCPPDSPESLTGDSPAHKHINVWGQTVSGAKYFPADMSKSNFTIPDVIAALSKICRFCGHIKEFYSVAQHSVYVALRVKQILTNDTPLSSIAGFGENPSQQVPNDVRRIIYAMTLWALFHDGAEAFFQDMPSPTKMTLTGNYVELSDAAQLHILELLGFRRGCSGNIWFYKQASGESIMFSAKLMKDVCKRADIEVLCSESAVLVNKAGQEWASDKTHGPVKGLEVIPMLPAQSQGKMTSLWKELVQEIEFPVSRLY